MGARTERRVLSRDSIAMVVYGGGGGGGFGKVGEQCLCVLTAVVERDWRNFAVACDVILPLLIMLQ